MRSTFSGWDKVAEYLCIEAAKYERQPESNSWLNSGQCASIRAIAQRIPNNGIIIADEVGMGKTRIAVAVANSVVKAGGRVAILIPPGLGYQWEQELKDGGITNVPSILRSQWAYFTPWQNAEDEVTEKPWFANAIVMISHAFTNWRIGLSSPAWRKALLPEIYAQWQLATTGRLPRYYNDSSMLTGNWGNDWVRKTAKSIVESIPTNGNHAGKKILNEVSSNFEWHSSLDENYGQDTNQRKWLEQCVGLGLGPFDLVIIDEAHKCRGSDTGLSRLLDNVIFQSKNARRLGMSATPIELDVWQWSHTLTRIGIDKTLLNNINQTIVAYSDIVRKLRRVWRGSEDTLQKFKDIAFTFHSALSPYVLRRDKREDVSVLLFQQHANRPISEYRHEEEIAVDIFKIPQVWQQAVCAAESLSFTTRGFSGHISKRLRLTLGNGHGLSALLDQVKHDTIEDQKQDLYDDNEQTGVQETDTKQSKCIDDKRMQRTQWWHASITKAFEIGIDPLFEHPAIKQAIETIERECTQQEKVLVFGRFTLPMRRLVDLLNARAMFFALSNNTPWPQATIHGKQHESADDSEWPAVRAAHRQLKEILNLGELDELKLCKEIERQYNRFESRRQRFREKLIIRLLSGFTQLGLDKSNRLFKSFEAFCRAADKNNNDDLQFVSRAIIELICSIDISIVENADDKALALTFCDLIRSASDRDDPDIDADDDGVIDEKEADNYWNLLKNRIKEEFGRIQGGFARLMYGGTSTHSRRMIQLAFNRVNSYPKVLVAQSMVGREGLNLHKACRTVVMLHPEWNPGVSEQQIGRVDRVACHWSIVLKNAIENGIAGEALPRIKICPVIFRGTYDEYNWQVLRERWDDLRSQLHGIVVPDRFAENDPESKRIIAEIAEHAPNFSPSFSR